MYYPKEEQETVIIYESATKLFDIYTTVPKHIKRLTEYYTDSLGNCQLEQFLEVEKDSEGICIAIRIKASKLPYVSIFNK